jgi:hypothetical protein
MNEHAISLINYLITGRMFQVALWKIASTIGLKIGFEICWCIIKKILHSVFKWIFKSSFWFLNRLFNYGKLIMNYFVRQLKQLKLGKNQHDEFVNKKEGKKNTMPLSFFQINFFNLILLDTPPNRKKTYFKMQDESLIILTKWLLDNSISPYASRATKIELAQKTNLSIDQVTSWLNEARKKKRKQQK